MLTRRELLATLACTVLASSVVEEGQMMDQRISIVTPEVKDLAVSRRFYVDGLDWKPAFENKEIIFFRRAEDVDGQSSSPSPVLPPAP